MPVILLCVFRIVRLLFSGHQAVAVENIALRLQLAAFKRKRKRPVLTQADRLFWVGISRLWSGWRDVLVFVQPDRVVCGGNGNGSASSGPAYLNPSVFAEGDRPSPVAFEGLFCEWLRPIPSGAPQNPWRTEDAR